jgi:lipoprotein-anchoring transpeptidase ErfK/SrfK
VRPRSSLLALALAAVLFLPVACSSSHPKAAAAHRRAPRATPTTVSAGPSYLTEIATAKVPVVQVLAAKPGSPSWTAPPSTVAASSSLPAIPRPGLNAAGVSATPYGYAYNNPTFFGNPLVFDVVHDEGQWLEVSLLARPNHQTGWVKRSDVTLSTTRYHLRLQLSTYDLQAFNGDRKVLDTHVVVGTRSTPTPLGSYFITEKIARPPAGAYGPWILATSAYSEALDSFDGGLPQVAFHGTNRPELIGTRSSNGCVRMPDAVDVQLDQVLPAGTPITIVG